MNRRHFFAAAIVASLCGSALAQDSTKPDYGKPDAPVTLVVGYQPYYTQSRAS